MYCFKFFHETFKKKKLIASYDADDIDDIVGMLKEVLIVFGISVEVEEIKDE